MAKGKALAKADYEKLAAFRFALRQFLHFSEEAALGAGLTPQKHQALLAIKGFPGRDHVTVGELAERLQVRHHSAVGLIDRLVADRLLLRSPGSTDRRVVHLRLSAQGEKVLARLSEAHQEQLRRMGPKILGLLESVARGTSE